MKKIKVFSKWLCPIIQENKYKPFHSWENNYILYIKIVNILLGGGGAHL